jgi:hypothetical protein
LTARSAEAPRGISIGIFRPFQGLCGKWPIPMARAMGYSLALYEL